MKRSPLTGRIWDDSDSSGSDPDDGKSDTSNDKTNKIGKRKNRKNKREHCQISLSGLLNAVDGIASSEGRILFNTKIHLERIDEVFSRPSKRHDIMKDGAEFRTGRCGVKVPFGYATKAQAFELFNHIYQTNQTPNKSTVEIKQAYVEKILPPPTPDISPQTSPTFHGSYDNIVKLAKAFAMAIPEDIVCVLTLQGFLMQYTNELPSRWSIQWLHE